ncbi:hypothetical protein Cgig2_017096 [Carnegiea gigantea]|uniref:Uncharacterized protein n=1 Tax=Carnegiea gigantea TaxID=171969 RepID=A0A9Q1K485_9CARY|nr:hypothetical protein Cgig2_017096 [Carnegiea gigantea]
MADSVIIGYIISDLESYNVAPSFTQASIMDVSKGHENYFNVNVLDKVNTEHRGEEKYPSELEAYSFLRSIYKELLPLNRDLADYSKYLAIVIGLLRINIKLCKFIRNKHIYYDLWMDHFYKVTMPISPMGNKWTLRWGKLRQSISLASIMLGNVYYDCGEAGSHLDHPRKANIIFMIHYVDRHRNGRYLTLKTSPYHEDSLKAGHIEGQLNNLSGKGSKLGLKEKETLKEEGKICKMRSDLTI